MKWYIVAGIGIGIVVVAYAASRRIAPASSSSGQRPGLDKSMTPPFVGIAVGEPHPSPTNPKSAGVMAGYPGYESFWSGGDCNCGGAS